MTIAGAIFFPRPLRHFLRQAPELHPITLRFVDRRLGDPAVEDLLDRVSEPAGP